MSKNEGIFWRKDKANDYHVRCLFSGDFKAYHILDNEDQYVISNPWPTLFNFCDTNYNNIAPKELGLWK